MAPETQELKGDALRERAAELDIQGRSEMNADQLRDAVADAEADRGSADDDNADRVDSVRAALEEEIEDSPVSASPEQNAELEHTQGGVTTRDDALDQGVPMLQGDADEPVGPEDAGGVGPKRGDYAGRALASLNAHEAVRIDDGAGGSGPVVTNEDGGIDTLPHTRLEPQAPRALDQGEAPGEKGGVDTDPRS